MNHHIELLGLLLALCLGFQNCATEKRNCKFEDTIDLRSAHRFPYGSYLYADNVLITADQVEIYDYAEVFDGKRIPLEPHPRACLCNREDGNGEKIYCLKFCCQQPVREYISNSSIGCEEMHTDLPYTAHYNISYENATIITRDITKDLLAISGIPCQNAYAADDNWMLYANGTLSLFGGELHVPRRDYCMMFAPNEKGKEKLLTAMLCPVPVVNEEITLDAITSIAGIITTLFILITLLVYVLHPKLQNFQSKLLACFLFSLSMGSLTLSIIALPNVVFPHFICGVIGYLGYFFLLVSYCWLNVISFNMLRQLQKSIDHLSDKKRFILYAGYAMGIPLLMVLLLIILEHSNISISFKSGIGGDYCWFSPLNWSALIYWFGIDAILLCLDVSFYLVVILSLKALLKSQPDSKEYLQQLKFAYRYGTLVLVMAISCLIDATANIKSVHQSSDEHSWFYLSSFVSAIQGFVIFLIFGLGPLRQWRHQRFCRRIGYVRDDVQASNFENIEI